MVYQKSRDSIVQKFNENAEKYDSQRSKLIPCFDDFYSIPVSIMNSPSSKQLFWILVQELVYFHLLF